MHFVQNYKKIVLLQKNFNMEIFFPNALCSIYIRNFVSKCIEWNGQTHISYLWTYDLYGPIRNTFDAGKHITRASGRGLGPENREFFEPCEMASSR